MVLCEGVCSESRAEEGRDDFAADETDLRRPRGTIPMADSGTELSNKVKDQGNALFGKGKYAAAREAYTEAIVSADTR